MSRKTFKKSLIGLAIICGIVAFCMMFISPLSLAGEEFSYEFAILGQTTTVLGIEVTVTEPNLVALSGFGLALVGVVISILMLLKPKKRGLIYFILSIASIAAFVVAGINIACTKQGFVDANNEIYSLVEDYIEINFSIYLASILCLVAAAANLLNIFVRVKKEK